jgi:type II secretory pathway component GspD/PulD (secretin)
VRTNQIVVTDTPSQIEAVAQLLLRFDQPDLIVTKSIQLQYAAATDIADILREALTGRRQSSMTSLQPTSSTQQGPQVFTAPQRRPRKCKAPSNAVPSRLRLPSEGNNPRHERPRLSWA